MTDQIRTLVVSFRLTGLEAAHIDAAAAALRTPRGRADYCRAAALHAARAKVPAPARPVRRPARRLPAFDTRLLGQILGQVGRIGGNLNQLARTAHVSGALPTVDTLAALLAEIAAVRAALIAALNGESRDDGEDDR